MVAVERRSPTSSDLRLVARRTVRNKDSLVIWGSLVSLPDHLYARLKECDKDWTIVEYSKSSAIRGLMLGALSFADVSARDPRLA